MTSRNNRGFSLLELMAVVSIIFIVAVLAVPRIVSEVYTIRLQYSATEMSGLLQRMRIEAVRKNSFFSVQPTGGNPVLEQVVDKTGTVVTTIPPAPMGNTVNVFFGPGSGAPGEAAFLTGLNFGVAPGTSGLPSFNARGLPCMTANGVTCPMVPGQGYVFFLSGTTGSNNARGWASVAVTPSGRVEIWSYTGTSWAQI